MTFSKKFKISKNHSQFLYNKYFQQINNLETQLHSFTHLYDTQFTSTLLHYTTFQDHNHQLLFTPQLPQLKQIVISHTSKRVLQHPDSLIPILYAIQSLTSIPFANHFQNIFSSKSFTIAQLHIQKNALLGITCHIKGIYLFQFLQFLYNQPTLLNLLHSSSTPNFSIDNFFNILEFDQHYDHIISSFKTLDQFGARISFSTKGFFHNSLALPTLFALYHL